MALPGGRCDPDRREPLDGTTSEKVRFVTLTDPDGNVITLVDQR
jgi:hypothetical protein